MNNSYKRHILEEFALADFVVYTKLEDSSRYSSGQGAMAKVSRSTILIEGLGRKFNSAAGMKLYMEITPCGKGKALVQGLSQDVWRGKCLHVLGMGTG